MKRKFFLVGILAVLVLALGVGAFARFGHGHRRHGGHGLFGELGLGHIERHLNLTAEQSQQVREIFQRERTRIKEQFGSGSNDRLALAREIFKDNPNQAEIRQRVATMQQQHARMLEQIVAAAGQVNQVLTSEQRAEMQKLIEERAQIEAQRRERFQQRMREKAAPTN